MEYSEQRSLALMYLISKFPRVLPFHNILYHLLLQGGTSYKELHGYTWLKVADTVRDTQYTVIQAETSYNLLNKVYRLLIKFILKWA